MTARDKIASLLPDVEVDDITAILEVTAMIVVLPE
jgi:hypothetical protein